MKDLVRTAEQDALWSRLRIAVQENSAAAYRLKQVKDTFLSALVTQDERIGLLKRELISGDRHTALIVLNDLELEELKLVFPTLVWLTMSYNSSTFAALKFIRSLPRQWVVAELENTVAEQYSTDQSSESGDKYTAYMTIIEDMASQSRDDALALAKQATISADEEIREAGINFLQRSKE